MAKDDEITALFKKYIAEHGNEWKSVDYIKDPPKKYADVAESPRKDEQRELFLTKRFTVAETLQIINQWRKDNGGGGIVFFEDDIAVPENAYERMLPELKGDVWSVGGVQCPRMKTWHEGKALLIWNLDEGHVIRNIHYKQEKETGTDYFTSTATGFQIYSGEFLDKHDFPCNEFWGQDIFAGISIRNLGKKLAVCWDIKFVHFEHLGTEQALIFKSYQCKTPLYDTDGTDLTLNPALEYKVPESNKGKRRINVGKASPHYIYENRL